MREERNAAVCVGRVLSPESSRPSADEVAALASALRQARAEQGRSRKLKRSDSSRALSSAVRAADS